MDPIVSDVLAMTSMQTQVEIATAVMKKQNDAIKQQGDMILQMLESVTPLAPEGSLGHNIDVKA